MISIILGILLVIALVLFRFGQGSYLKEFRSVIDRFKKTSMNNTGASVTPPNPKSKSLPVKQIIVIAILIALFVHFYTGIGFLGLEGYSKTFEIEVATLEPHQLCGVPPGEYSFTVPKGREVEVFIGREKTDITSAVRVNKTVPNEPFSVKENGCVEISFAVNESFQKNAFAKQIIAIKIN